MIANNGEKLLKN